MKQFLIILLYVFLGSITGYLIYKIPEVGIPLFLIFLILIIVFKTKKYKRKETYWIVTAQTPEPNGGIKMKTILFKVNNKFFTRQNLQNTLNNNNSNLLDWNIIFCYKLTKEEYDIYTHIKTIQNEQSREESQNRENY